MLRTKAFSSESRTAALAPLGRRSETEKTARVAAVIENFMGSLRLGNMLDLKDSLLVPLKPT
jgi:hypothetical protein